MLNQSIRVRDLAQDPKWKAITDGETMIVHVVMPKAEESATAATERRRSGAGGSGRARSHQEGQGREGRKKKKK